MVGEPIEIRYGTTAWLLLVLGFGWFGFVVWALLTLGYSDPSELPIALLLALGGLFTGILGMLMRFRLYVKADENGVESRSLLGRVENMTWDEVISVNVMITRYEQKLVLLNKKGIDIRVGLYMRGTKQLVELIRTHTAPNIHEEAVKRFKAARLF